MGAAIRGIEEPLRLALEATSTDFQRWEEGADDEGYEDEFGFTPEQVAALSHEWRNAYVARLLVDVAHAYGISANDGVPAKNSIGGVVRALFDIARSRRPPPLGS